MGNKLNERAIDLYNVLDSALKTKAGIPDSKSGIAAYILVLPARESAILKGIKNWRNNATPHVPGEAPVVPYSWISFLQSEISRVERSGYELKNKLIKASAELDRRKRHTGTQTKKQSFPQNGKNKDKNKDENKNKNKKHVSGGGHLNKINGTVSKMFFDRENEFRAEFEISEAKGYYTEKHLFKDDREMLDFNACFKHNGKLKSLRVTIHTPHGDFDYPMSSMTVQNIKLPREKMLGNTVKMTVNFEYKVGVFATKTGKITVSKAFYR